ncbi:unnamed protein product [Urochloa humidicola]
MRRMNWSSSRIYMADISEDSSEENCFLDNDLKKIVAEKIGFLTTTATDPEIRADQNEGTRLATKLEAVYTPLCLVDRHPVHQSVPII